MGEESSKPTSTPTGTVFLSYASQDAEAVQKICEALRAAGIEVFLDQSELRGGDVWDQKIRRQIQDCALFIPVISANTASRPEGYFRLEWDLADQRTHMIARSRVFVVPVCLDATTQLAADVPESFRRVQWTRLPGGETSPVFVERIKRLLSPEVSPTSPVAPGALGIGERVPASQRLKLLLMAIAVVIVAGLAYLFADRLRILKPLIPPARVVPYSAADRRMTFAVLPFAAPAGDTHAGEVARAMTELVQARLEANSWAQAATSSEVNAALPTATAPRSAARALSVHFLFRNAIEQTQSGYQADIAVLDGETERTLGRENLAIPAKALVPTRRSEVDRALGHEIYLALRMEVERAQGKPDSALDVRDLTYRAWARWGDFYSEDSHKGYQVASALLARALTQAPEDLLALRLTATINLCECVEAWSSDPEQQRGLAARAITRYLRADPSGQGVNLLQAKLAGAEGRWGDALVFVDALLRRRPDDGSGLELKAVALVKTGRPKEALPLVDELVAQDPDGYSDRLATASAVHYAVGDYEAAASLAERAIALLRPNEQTSPLHADVRLTLVAAEAQLGHAERARRALEDFWAAVPNVKTNRDIRRWLKPYSDLEGFEPLYTGLSRAGVPD